MADVANGAQSTDSSARSRHASIVILSILAMVLVFLLVLLVLVGLFWLGRERNLAPGADGAWAPTRSGFQTDDEVEQLVAFLTNEPLVVTGDGEFQTVRSPTPRSFVTDDERFWANYVCRRSDCAVTDVIRNDPFSLLGDDLTGEAAALQVERVLASTGTNIYDAAVWQIAVALSAELGTLDRSEADALVSAQRQRLHRLDSRASSSFTYRGTPSSTDPASRYAIRFLGPDFFVADPLLETSLAGLVATAVPPGDPLVGMVTWADWKPITGENAWAFLLGPLQATYLLNGSDASKIPLTDPAVLDAIAFLEPLEALQSELGAVNYSADQSLGNDGSPVPAGTVSVENMVSVAAGLRVLGDILDAQIDSAGGTGDAARLAAARIQVDELLHGTADRIGLVPFMRDRGESSRGSWLVQGGIVSGSSFVDNEADPVTNDFAVDVNTWGIAALGPATIDQWWGSGTAHQIWQTTKQRGGYVDTDGTFLGVGYTDNASPGQQVLAGEWSFGALLAVRSLLQHYGSLPADQLRVSGVDLVRLEDDVATMEAGMLRLRTDRYHAADNGAWASFPDGLPPENGVVLPDGQLGFLYASKRVEIPFGWIGNPLPSTASSAWAMLWSYWYNPFSLGGFVGPADWSPVDRPALVAMLDNQDASRAVTIVNATTTGELVVVGASDDVDTLPAGSFENLLVSGPLDLMISTDGGALVGACTVDPNQFASAPLVVTVVDGPSCQ